MLVRGTDASVIAPAYKLVPYGTWKDAFDLIKENGTNELIVGKEMMHVYPLMPIPEAKPACRLIFRKIMR